MHHAALFAGLTALAIGLMIPPLGKIFHRPEFGEHAVTLWLMLLGVWIKLNADMQYYVLFARRQDTAIWVGDLAYLLPALGGNALLVPLFGFNGIGYAAILSAIFLFIWRSWHVKNFSYPQPSTST